MVVKRTRSTFTHIKKECDAIKKYWSEAWTDRDIMDKLGLSRAQYMVRLKYIARDRFDANRDVTLLQYQIKKQKRYDQLEALLITTMDDKLKLECIQEMGRIDDGFVEMGQRLGIFAEAPKTMAGIVASVDVPISESGFTNEFKSYVIDRTKEMLRNKLLPNDTPNPLPKKDDKT